MRPYKFANLFVPIHIPPVRLGSIDDKDWQVDVYHEGSIPTAPCIVVDSLLAMTSERARELSELLAKAADVLDAGHDPAAGEEST